ncbi:hypothetical protein Efla_005538 [Eimeria flavescens]
MLAFQASRGGAASLKGLPRSLLSASPRSSSLRAIPLLQGQRRFLGNEVRGPDFDPCSVKTWKLRPHMCVLRQGMSQSFLSYNEFKQFCESLRLLLFVGGSVVVAADMLFFHPTRAAYWRLFGPIKWPSLLMNPFKGQKGTSGVFEFEQKGLTKQPDGTVKTAAYSAFEKTLK